MAGSVSGWNNSVMHFHYSFLLEISLILLTIQKRDKYYIWWRGRQIPCVKAEKRRVGLFKVLSNNYNLQCLLDELTWVFSGDCVDFFLCHILTDSRYTPPVNNMTSLRLLLAKSQYNSFMNQSIIFITLHTRLYSVQNYMTNCAQYRYALETLLNT